MDLLEDKELKFISFHGVGMMSGPGTHGYVSLKGDDFSRLAYARFPGISRNNIEDLLHAVRVMAPDRSDLDKFICFHDKIWDMQKLEFTNDTLEWVYTTNIRPTGDKKAAWKFLTELSLGDEGLARDYLQSMAPLLMYRKPVGVIWFVGSGSNGKSSLINALYRILGQFFTSMTTSAIEDGRDTPRLNGGVLGNICRESSESRVEDTERYKAIGTHEPFTIHKFHSQETIEVTTNFHAIFNANNVPVFSDKTKGARRRTLIVPFPAHFRDDPNFDDRTFTPEFLGGLIELLLEETKVIAENGYRYKWSDATIKAKEQYDSEVNSVEAYLEYLNECNVMGFVNYAYLKNNYESWCNQNGLIPLGMTTLKRVMANEGSVIRTSVRTSDNKILHRYQFPEAIDMELEWKDDGYGFATAVDAATIEANKRNPYQPRKLSKDW